MIDDLCVTTSCVAGACVVQALDCNDGDVCSEDACDSLIGCVHRQSTFDADGDGFNGPRAGYAPGEVGACGEDCDDRSDRAFPGNPETCDGVDNDCNGVVDDGAAYDSPRPAVRVSSREYSRAQRGGFVATGDSFAFTYTGDLPPAPGSSASGRDVAVLAGITARGDVTYETKVTNPNSNAYAGSLAWSGERLVTAWNDPREGAYDIFSRAFNASGGMLGSEQRVSSTPSFSLSPNVVWNQTEFLLFWDDRRDEGSVSGDYVQILAQRLRPDGTLTGPNALVVDGPVTENPMPAFGAGRIGLAYTSLVPDPNGVPDPIDPSLVRKVSRLGFRVLDQSLTTIGQATELGTDVELPTLQFVQDRFIAFWVVNSDNSWGDAVWAVMFDALGTPLGAPARVTFGARYARSHSELSLGDRLLMVWADDFDGNYELYFQILGPDLSVIVPRRRLTTTDSPSVSPALAAGPLGTIGVLYNDSPEGPREVWFKSLECLTRSP